MKTKILAEIGINHNGDINIAKKLIDIASFAGCYAVKFQKRDPDICVPEHQKNQLRQTPWGEMKYIDYKYKIEFGLKEYTEIDQYCKQKNINWSVSVWDINSFNFIKYHFPHVSFIKIPSPKIVDYNLIKKVSQWCSKTNKIFIFSRGMSTEEEINTALTLVRRKITKKENIVLMHCNSTYPASNDELNLNCITTLKNKYSDITIGYSDHAFGIVPCLTSAVLGAQYVEKHITLDRTMWGSDQMASCEPHGLIKLCKDINEVEKSLGDGEIRVYESENKKKKSLRG